MKLAIYQGPESGASMAQNLEALAEQAQLAAAQGARLLIASEMFLSGYNLGAEAINKLAQAADGEGAQALAEIARSAGIALLYGYPELQAGKVYNAAQFIDAEGKRRGNYRKTHLFGDLDRNLFSPGEAQTVVIDLDGWRIGILICYDVEFPENVRRLALQGADLIAVPTALMNPYDFIPRVMVPARAYENQLFVAYANRCGHESELEYSGLSCIVGPDGRDLARAGAGVELIVAELDTDLLARSRQLNPYLRDRRPELYQDVGADDINNRD